MVRTVPINDALLKCLIARSCLRIEARPPASDAVQDLDGYTLEALKNFYNHDSECMHHILDRNPTPGTDRLRNSARFYDYILLDGRRITPMQRTLRKTVGSSILKVILHGQSFCGLVQSFFRHKQRHINNDTLWAKMIWMEYQDLLPIQDDPWSN
jgi:hypothetical protein